MADWRQFYTAAILNTDPPVSNSSWMKRPVRWIFAWTRLRTRAGRSKSAGKSCRCFTDRFLLVCSFNALHALEVRS